MDIESIKRTNELSRILRNHGLAQDAFEAIKKASKYSKKESDALKVNPASLKQEIMDEPNEPRARTERTERTGQTERAERTTNNNNYHDHNNQREETDLVRALKNKIISLERSKHLLNNRVDEQQNTILKLQQENKELNERVERIESKIKFLSRGVAGSSSSATNPPVTAAPATSPSHPQNKETINNEINNNGRGAGATAQLPATPTNSRSANSPGNRGIDPQSVSIENIFYCGTR